MQNRGLKESYFKMAALRSGEILNHFQNSNISDFPDWTNARHLTGVRFLSIPEFLVV